MQTRRQALLEVTTNTLVGLAGSWAITYLVMATVDDRAVAAVVTVAGCTVWSLVRGYCIRRRFGRKEAAS